MSAVFTHIHWGQLVDGILNPNTQVGDGSGPRIGKWALCPLWSARPLRGPTASRKEFRAALRASIKAEGIRNPVLVCELGRRLYLRYGVSRVVESRNLEEAGHPRLSIPAIVTGPELRSAGRPVTPENLSEFFKDQPQYVVWEDDGYLNYCKCWSEFDRLHGNLGMLKEIKK